MNEWIVNNESFKYYHWESKNKFLEDKMSVTNFKFGNNIIVSLIVIIHLQVFNLISIEKINERGFYQAWNKGNSILEWKLI